MAHAFTSTDRGTCLHCGLVPPKHAELQKSLAIAEITRRHDAAKQAEIAEFLRTWVAK